MPSPYVSNYGLDAITAASVTLSAAAHAGHTIAVNRAAGCDVTLPAATGSGNRYTVTTVVDQTGDLVIAADGDDTMQGVALTDMTGVIFATADDTDTITLNGTTSGGLKGARVELIDVAASIWNVVVISESSGVEVTPFSAAA